MSSEVVPASRGFPEAPLVATTDPEVQRLRAAVEARLTGGEVEPARIGRFVVLARVGQGAMGVVYAGFDRELDRKVAIKMLHATRDDPDMRARLLREAQAMARLSHPNVVTVHETGDEGGVGFVVMEFVRGLTLRQWQHELRPTQAELLAAYQQAGRGLAAAHGAGVVHRDFKPDNVLVEGDAADPRVRVADFGLASTRAGDSTTTGTIVAHDGADEPAALPPPLDSAATRPGARMGTPGYMAPEQILAEPTDARADQFAFCVALWEALVGARPFVGRTTTEQFSAVLSGAIEAPPRGSMPAHVEAALRTGLALRAEERHASMDVLLRLLAVDPRRRRRRRVLAGLLIAAVPAVLAVTQARTALAHRACDERAAAIDEVWNPEVATRVSTAIVDTAALDAGAAATRAEAELAAYAERWREMADVVCVAADIDHSLDAEATERATACLDERRQAFAGTIDAITTIDAAVVDNVVRTVLFLPMVERCNDARALALELPPPTDPERRAELRRIQAELASIEALRRLGRTAEALDRLAALEAPAAALQWPAIEARVAYRRAHLSTDSAERVLDLGQRAFFAAFRVGDDETVSMSAALLSYATGVLAGDQKAGEHWDALASAALDRLPGEQRPAAELFLTTIQGRRLMIHGDNAGAEAALERGLAAGATLYGPDHVLLTDTLLTLANSQCRRDAWSECRATHERAYTILAASLGEEHPWTARALAGYGLSLGYDGDPQRGLELLGRALVIDERRSGPDHLDSGIDRQYMGLVMLQAHEPERALEQFERATAVIRAAYPPGHPEIAVSFENIVRAHATIAGKNAALAAGKPWP